MAATPTKVIRTYTGDTAPDLTFSITREDGTIVDLTGATVTFTIFDPVTGLATNDPNPSTGATNVCTVTNASGGKCVYSWNNGRTDTPDVGYYKSYLKILYADGTRESYELTLAVEYAPLIS